MNRLHIVVPFRDRIPHLEEFVPHVRAYFAADDAARHIPYRVTIVEQEGGSPFNRGALKNIGFLLGLEQSDYTCFHDVDYLPVNADYSWAPAPTCSAWYGAELRPIALGKSSRAILHDLDKFFGGCVLIPNKTFLQINGYANSFWGWGFEDEDLRERFLAAGIKTARRKGTFKALYHENEGYNHDASYSPIARVNKSIYEAKRAAGGDTENDGLSTLPFQILNRQTIRDSLANASVAWEMVTVRLGIEPRPEHIEALMPPKISWIRRLLSKSVR